MNSMPIYGIAAALHSGTTGNVDPHSHPHPLSMGVCGGSARVRFSSSAMEFVWEVQEDGGKRVSFLIGGDGEPMVVILGDDAEEVDSILEERAKHQAELETEAMKKAAEEELDKLVRLSRSTVRAMEEQSSHKHVEKTVSDPTREAVVKSLHEATLEMEKEMKALELQDPEGNDGAIDRHTAESSIPSGIPEEKVVENSTPNIPTSSLTNGENRPHITVTPYNELPTVKKLDSSFLKVNGIKDDIKPIVSSSVSKAYPKEIDAPMSIPHSPAMHAVTLSQVNYKPLYPSSTNNVEPLKGDSIKNGASDASDPSNNENNNQMVSDQKPHQVENIINNSDSNKNEDEKPKNIFTLCTTANNEQERLSTSGVAAHIEQFERLSESSLEALKSATLERAKKHRQKEILDNLRRQVDAARKQAAEKDILWQEQERKAKEAEQRIREIARRAREEHRRTSFTSLSSPSEEKTNSFDSSSIYSVSKISSPTPTRSSSDINGNVGNENELNTVNGHLSNGISPTNPARMSQLQRPSKPPSKESIISWFKEEELPKGAGLDRNKAHVSPWFHGIISRGEAERLLNKAELGSFLIRVSERIWGYVVSYRGVDRCRHYLVDVVDGKYAFLGSQETPHNSLDDLVEYHSKEPITAAGCELLTKALGQEDADFPDYSELFFGTRFLAR